MGKKRETHFSKLSLSETLIQPFIILEIYMFQPSDFPPLTPKIDSNKKLNPFVIP